MILSRDFWEQHSTFRNGWWPNLFYVSPRRRKAGPILLIPPFFETIDGQNRSFVFLRRSRAWVVWLISPMSETGGGQTLFYSHRQTCFHHLQPWPRIPNETVCERICSCIPVLPGLCPDGIHAVQASFTFFLETIRFSLIDLLIYLESKTPGIKSK